MLPLSVLISILILLIFLNIRLLRIARRMDMPHAHPTLELKASASLAISELSDTIANLIGRYIYMSAHLATPDPGTHRLGPVVSEFETLYIKEGLTHDMAERMIVVLRSAYCDLKIEEAAVKAFWELWEGSGGHMLQDEVTRGVEMLTEWSDGKRGSVAKDVVAEAQKYFRIDEDRVVLTPVPTPQQVLDEAAGQEAAGQEAPDGGSGGSRKRRKKGKKKGRA